MTFDFGFFAALAAALYVLNIVRTRDLSADRLLLRAPVVAVFATLIYGPVALAAGSAAGLMVALPLVWCDVTPGKMLGKHA